MGKVIELPKQTPLQIQIRRLGHIKQNHDREIKELMKPASIDVSKCRACDSGMRFY